ncbi:MAG: DUF2905 family protein [Burkholderiaceae bacterium]|nr:DUF2905 family protein [Burkholderiaceae bacterium]
MRWLIVFLLAFLVFNGLRGWLEKIGLGRLPDRRVDLSPSPDRIHRATSNVWRPSVDARRRRIAVAHKLHVRHARREDA